jgi:CHAD domain-containing protein
MYELAAREPDGTRLPARVSAPDRPLPSEVQRISLHLLDRTIADLRPDDPSGFDAGIHSARKKMKRLRGLLRLVREEIGYRSYREENVVLRDTARSLSAVRDAWVSVATLRSLRESYADLLDPNAFVTPEGWLLARHQQRRRSVTGAVVTNAITNLGSASSRFAEYPIEETVRNDYQAIAPGIERVYRRGYRAMARVAESARVENLHEWRKRVKYLRFQMETLAPLYPPMLKATAAGLDDLGELLGDDHDLAVLADTIIEHPESCRNERERWMLIALIHERRAHLQSRALSHGTALYGEKPKTFVHRIASYWQAGRR